MSNNFPAKNAFNSTYGGGTFNAFVAEFNSSGGLLYSTFLGGNGDDSGSVISVDTNGSYYITGTTQSADFPTENVFNATYSSYSNVFLSKFDSQNNLVLVLTLVENIPRESIAFLLILLTIVILLVRLDLVIFLLLMPLIHVNKTLF